MEYIASDKREFAETILKNSYRVFGRGDMEGDYVEKGMKSFVELHGKAVSLYDKKEIIAHLIFYHIKNGIYGIGDFWIREDYRNLGLSTKLLSLLDSSQFIASIPNENFGTITNKLFKGKLRAIKYHPIHEDYTWVTTFDLRHVENRHETINKILNGTYDI
jgi:hypothetical protein